MSQPYISNKIAILISWPREIDFFQNLLNKINNDYIYIVDDLSYSNSERNNNKKNIVEIFENKNKEYEFVSQILDKKIYKILISTGLTYFEKVTIKSFLLFLYSRTIGYFFERSNISILFLKLFNTRLSGGGKNRQIFEEIPIEKNISEISYHFPRGLDISMNAHPHPRWENQYDYYLTHGNIDKKLISESFNNAKCIKIGYPKYDLNIQKKNTLNKILNQ